MWIAIIIGAFVLFAIIGWLNSDGKDSAGDALGAGCGGAMMAGGCLWQLLLAGLGILVTLWLFGAIFG